MRNARRRKRDTAKRLTLTPEQRATGLHIVGGPGSGKSKLMEHLIRADISAAGPNAPALIMIDPHGSLYSAVVDYCAWRRPRRPLYFLNVSAGDPVQPFNPFLSTGADAPVLVDRCIEATIKAQGAANTDETPRLERWLRALFHVIVERGLSIAEAALLLDYNARAVRTYLSSDTSVAAAWQELDQAKTPTQFEDQLGSTKNRITRFTAARAVCRFMAVTDPALNLDLVPLMDAGGILLVNLQPSGTLSPMNARLFGSLLVARIFEAARRRELRSGRPPRPCHVYLDEFQNFVTLDLAEMLAQGRKMGLALTLAHQILEQVRAEDPRILAALHGAAGTKIVFRVGSNADATELVHEVWPGQINYNEVKRTDYELRFQPVDTRDTSRTVSRGGGANTTHGTSRQRGTSETISETESHERGRNQSQSISLTNGRSHGRAIAQGQTDTEGYTHTVGSADTTATSLTTGQSVGEALSVATNEDGRAITTATMNTGDSESLTEMAGHTDSENDAYSTSAARSKSVAVSQGETTAATVAAQQGESESEGRTRGRTAGVSVTEGTSETEGRNTTWSESETDGPVTKHVAYQHPIQTVHSLDEQRQRRADELRCLPQRVCIVRLPNGTAQPWTVPEVKPVRLSRRRVAEYEAEVSRKAGALSAAAVETMIQERREQIEAAAVVNLDADHGRNRFLPQSSPISLPYESTPRRIAARRRIRPTPRLNPANGKTKPSEGSNGSEG